MNAWMRTVLYLQLILTAPHPPSGLQSIKIPHPELCCLIASKDTNLCAIHTKLASITPRQRMSLTSLKSQSLLRFLACGIFKTSTQLMKLGQTLYEV